MRKLDYGISRSGRTVLISASLLRKPWTIDMSSFLLVNQPPAARRRGPATPRTIGLDTRRELLRRLASMKRWQENLVVSRRDYLKKYRARRVVQTETEEYGRHNFKF